MLRTECNKYGVGITFVLKEIILISFFFFMISALSCDLLFFILKKSVLFNERHSFWKMNRTENMSILILFAIYWAVDIIRTHS